MENFNNPEFLDKKYQDLAGSKPVERAVKKVKGQSPHTRSERIDTYLDRLEKVFGQEGDEDERGFELLKYKVLNTYVTKPEEIPESYWKLQETVMREQGQLGDWNNASEKQREEIKKQNSEGVLSDQRASLEEWIDYFHLKDSNYIPRELKYWIFRNIIKLQEFDKKKSEFPKRSKGTVKQFPDLNQEALNYVIDNIIKKYEGKSIEWEHDIQLEERKQFEHHLAKEDFAKLYSWAHELMNPIPEHLLPVTEGEWRKFEQGTDSNELVKTIRGKGTGWCTAGQTTAKTQLSNGAFYVYYSLDDNQEATIPRLAIRMEDNKIAEVRGIAYKQNIDPYMGDVLETKLDEFPDKDQYLKKKDDMEKLTQIDNKLKKDPQIELSKQDLEFLYEINTPIEGFGYKKDPRIQEILSKRDKIEDASSIFECTRDQIATGISEINGDTRAYIGEWNPRVHENIKDYPNIIHLYESFPDKKIFKFELTTDPTLTRENCKQRLEEKGIYVSPYAEDLINKTEFSKEQQEYSLVQFTVAQLGFPDGATTDEICQKAQGLGLELCPAEVGPHLRLAYSGKDWKRIAMKQIAGRDGYPRVFYLDSDDDRLELRGNRASPSLRWCAVSPWVFRFRK